MAYHLLWQSRTLVLIPVFPHLISVDGSFSKPEFEKIIVISKNYSNSKSFQIFTKSSYRFGFKLSRIF